MAPSGGKYKIGAAVEVLGAVDGFEYSWALAKVLKVSKDGKHEVEYTDFMDGKLKMVEKSIELGRLRPMQAKVAPSKWMPGLGQLIEVFEDDLWWEGKVLKTVAKGGKSVLVMLRVSDEQKTYLLNHARPSAWWCQPKISK
ncbi:hypothetical protein T492DRAFT_436844 [Pavlovales sp. CCMP2436]|nr:hypothetical protein T492DRAFT_436844 [Pavlovales sp. CCMP2436]